MSFLSDEYFYRIDSLSDIDEYTPDQVVDSLKLTNTGGFTRYVSHQIVRIQRAGNESIVSYIIKNISVMMLLLIPIFALILKLLYIRRNIYYLKHLIHGLHIHSFSYLVYGIATLLVIFFTTDAWDDTVIIMCMGVVTIYSYLSFLRVYGQHWFKTLMKFILTGGIYIFISSFFFMGELLISLLLF